VKQILVLYSEQAHALFLGFSTIPMIVHFLRFLFDFGEITEKFENILDWKNHRKIATKIIRGSRMIFMISLVCSGFVE